MSNRETLKQLLGLLLLLGVLGIGLWIFIENVDYVETTMYNVNLEESTIEIQATIYIDSDPVRAYKKTVDYCDRKVEKKKLRKETKIILKEFKSENYHQKD